MMPLFAEALALSLSGFTIGLLFAYLIALRRHWIR
jgi:hypothetical protein